LLNNDDDENGVTDKDFEWENMLNNTCQREFFTIGFVSQGVAEDK